MPVFLSLFVFKFNHQFVYFQEDISSDTLLNDKTDSKHLYLRRLTAQLREKDIVLAKLLEGKMKVMKEMVDVVNKNPKNIHEFSLDNLEDSNLKSQGQNNGTPSQSCQTQDMNLPNPEYLNLVREQKDRNNYTKEQLLSAVQVQFFSVYMVFKK